MNSHQRYQHIPATGSTNQDLLDLAASGEPSPPAILCDHQSAGRGRSGRAWHNDREPRGPVQAMMGSIRHVWASDHPSLPMMPFAAGLAVRDACDRWADSGAPLRLKWPNDLVVKKQDAPVADESWFRKLAGILVETIPMAGTDRLAVVTGVGVNLHPIVETSDEHVIANAASLSEFCSVVPTNVELFEALLDDFDRWTETLRNDSMAVIQAYRDHCETVGHTVRTSSMEGPRVGEALAIADDGALVVDWGDGRESRVTYGDVSISR